MHYFFPRGLYNFLIKTKSVRLKPYVNIDKILEYMGGGAVPIYIFQRKMIPPVD